MLNITTTARHASHQARLKMKDDKFQKFILLYFHHTKYRDAHLHGYTKFTFPCLLSVVLYELLKVNLN